MYTSLGSTRYGGESKLMLTVDNINHVIGEMEKLSILRKMERVNDSTAKYKARVDDEAVETLKSISLPMAVDDLAEYKYIGSESKTHKPTIITRIKEILTRPDHTTSDYANTDSETKDRINVYSQLIRVPHIGLAYATKLYNNGIRTINDLTLYSDQLLQQGLITAAQHKGIALYSSNLGNIGNQPVENKFPRIEGDAYAEQLQYVFHKFNTEHGVNISFMITGSYRRGSPYLGDIDVLIADNDGKLTDTIQHLLLQELGNFGLITNLISSGHTKVSGYCDTSRFVRNGGIRRVDYEFVYDNWSLPAELLYFTGDLNFNTSMRLKAKNMGYHLTNDGLYYLNPDGSIGAKIQTASEDDIFNILGMIPVDPTQRSSKKSM